MGLNDVQPSGRTKIHQKMKEIEEINGMLPKQAGCKFFSDGRIHYHRNEKW